MKLTRSLLAALALATAAAAHAAAPPPPAPSPLPAAARSVHLAVGQVHGFDAAERLLTVDHQDIPSLRMPAMTMDFPVHESVDASRLRTGGTYAFLLVPVGDTLVVSALQAVDLPAGAAQGPAAGMGAMPGMKDGQMPRDSGMGTMAECQRMMRGR